MFDFLVQNWVIFAVILALAIVTMAAVWVYAQRKKTENLRNHFGSEYDVTVTEIGSRSKAERELAERRDRLSKKKIRPLTFEEVNRFSEDWWRAQARFVEDPKAALRAADRLVQAVLTIRGYEPDDVSAAFPEIAGSYRMATSISNKRESMTTEDMRKGMVLYRILFDQLFRDSGTIPLRRVS